jgi:hypothetical protein
MTYLTGWRLALRRYVRGGNAPGFGDAKREHPAPQYACGTHQPRR